MSTCRFILVVGALVVFTCGCQSPNPKTQTSEARSSIAATQAAVSPIVTWPVPSDLPVIGTPSANSIRVAISGYSVKRPGYYYLLRGATVHDAIEAAQLSDIGRWQQPYSSIERQRPDGSVEISRFTRRSRVANEQRVLENNDRVFLSHEVY